MVSLCWLFVMQIYNTAKLTLVLVGPQVLTLVHMNKACSSSTAIHMSVANAALLQSTSSTAVHVSSDATLAAVAVQQRITQLAVQAQPQFLAEQQPQYDNLQQFPVCLFQGSFPKHSSGSCFSKTLCIFGTC